MYCLRVSASRVFSWNVVLDSVYFIWHSSHVHWRAFFGDLFSILNEWDGTICDQSWSRDSFVHWRVCSGGTANATFTFLVASASALTHSRHAAACVFHSLSLSLCTFSHAFFVCAVCVCVFVCVPWYKIRQIRKHRLVRHLTLQTSDASDPKRSRVSTTTTKSTNNRKKICKYFPVFLSQFLVFPLDLYKQTF